MHVASTNADRPVIRRASIEDSRVCVQWSDARRSHFHAIWLRDNCGCPTCRVTQTGERLLYTADIPDDLRVESAYVSGAGHLSVTWSDGHTSKFDGDWLAANDYSSVTDAPCGGTITLWGCGAELPCFEHRALMHSTGTLLEYLDALQGYGVAIVKGTPAVTGEVVKFAGKIGTIRNVAFGVVHDVINNPDGYNVAHTALELKPHSDLPSYTWPPSFQLLHYLSNSVTGGETVLVDGWNVAATLEDESLEDFEILSTVPVPFKIFSATDDTYAEEPIIQRHLDGRMKVFRFSNQAAQPLRIHPDRVEHFYKAYKHLGRLIADSRFRVQLKAESGDMLTIHNHRVLHGRLAYDPASGSRHLQDLYMEWDDVMAKRRVLKGHLPRDAWPASE